MRYSTYRKYKPSGFVWLNEIPHHWNVRKLKYISHVNFSSVDKHTVEGELPVRLCNYTDVYNNDFIYDNKDFMEATANKSEIRRFTLRGGDVLVTKDSESWEDIAVPAFVPADLEGVVCGYHLAQIHPNNEVLEGAYLFRAFLSRGINNQFRVESKGVTRFGLGKHSLDGGLFPLPPIDEQCTIASFLDYKTAQIDALIEKKQRQIELLHEKRTALISHAVTKGLNPNVRMKDSGIEWLGEVPEHWEVVRTKYVSSINDETLSETTCPDCEILYIDIGSVDASLGIQRKELLRFEDAPSRAKRKVRHGDVIVSTVRTYLRAIVPIIEPEDNLIVSTGFAIVRPRVGLDSGFAAYMLRAPYFVETVVARSVGVSYPAINASEIGNLYLAIPPETEQRAISNSLNIKTAQIDALTSKIKDSIEKLHEFRIALISAAVTGKINVMEDTIT